jgi:hypothetical protein
MDHPFLIDYRASISLTVMEVINTYYIIVETATASKISTQWKTKSICDTQKVTKNWNLKYTT